MIFHCWLHTGFIEHKSRFLRAELDGACKKKHKDKFPPNFAFEIETPPYALPLKQGASAATLAARKERRGSIEEETVRVHNIQLDALEYVSDSESDGYGEGAEGAEEDDDDETSGDEAEDSSRHTSIREEEAEEAGGRNQQSSGREEREDGAPKGTKGELVSTGV